MPACVVWVETKQAEVNWRCMGALPPKEGDVGLVAPVEAPVEIEGPPPLPEGPVDAQGPIDCQEPAAFKEAVDTGGEVVVVLIEPEPALLDESAAPAPASPGEIVVPEPPYVGGLDVQETCGRTDS